jgi:hypothetical protein
MVPIQRKLIDRSLLTDHEVCFIFENFAKIFLFEYRLII